MLCFEVFKPRFEALLRLAGIGEELFDFEWEQDGLRIKRFFKKLEVDSVNLSFKGAFIFRSYHSAGKLLKEESSRLKMTAFTRPQMEALLRLAGLKLVKVYGSFEKEPLNNDSPEMIFLAQRA